MSAIRKQVILTDGLVNTFDGIAEAQGANFSALVRIAMVYWLEHERGIKADPTVKRGGRREKRINS